MIFNTYITCLLVELEKTLGLIGVIKTDLCPEIVEINQNLDLHLFPQNFLNYFILQLSNKMQRKIFLSNKITVLYGKLFVEKIQRN